MVSNSDKTPLAMVMNHLHITSSRLASAIHVDSSLVSRWRTGKRTFNSSSPHYKATISYLLSQDEHIDYKNLAFFLSNYVPDVTIDSPESAAKALDVFLSAPFTYISSYHAPIHDENDSQALLNIIKGNKEIQAAILEFMDIALTFDNHRNIYLMFDKRSDVFFENNSWYKKWIEKLTRLIDKGHSIFYVYNSSEEYSNVVNLENFLQIYQAENCYIYSMRRSNVNSFNLLMIEDAFAITNFSASEPSRQYTVYSTSNAAVLSSIEQSFFNMLNNCEPMFSSLEEKTERIDRVLSGFQHINQDIFLYSSSFLDYPIPSNQLLDILEYNEIKGSERDMILSRYSTFIREPFLKNSGSANSMIINTDSFLNAMNYSEFELYPKLLSQQAIMVPKEYYHYYAEAFLEHLMQPNETELDFSVSLVNAKRAGLPENTLIYAVMGLFSYINNYSNNRQNYFLFTNPLFNTDIFNYLREIKNSLPDEANNVHRIKELLSRVNV